jgi:LuxR family transcriptional regulator, maltose regulon positive regulatory protein
VSTPVLATKLFAPTPRPQVVVRPRLLEQLDTTLDASHRLTVLSARLASAKPRCLATGSGTFTNP